MTAPLIALLASPRKRGNSAVLLDAFLEGVDEAGVPWEKIRTHALGIADCRSCGGCLRPERLGRCVVEDGMAGLLDRFRGAGGFVVATPVWFGGPPATLKAVVDRCQALYAVDPRFRKHPHDKPGALLAVGGMNLAWQDPGVRAVVRSFLASVYARLTGEVFVHGVDHLGEMSARTDALDEARQLGRDVAGAMQAREA